ncbi:unnamed protein product [Parnassius apollo]|uniref:(apollo) hypothetical protein n=1 Tax=Parnassius apollo TaxID=110799 RepID=A0A8S3Y313_PARAO|nr:unnamed protein product [Parnassius apollo]
MVNIINNIVFSGNTNKNIVWKQYLVSFFASLPFFTYGIENDFLTAPSNLGQVISTLNVPWSTVAFIVSSIVTAPIHCFIISKFGRKLGIYIVVILQGVICIPLLISSTDTGIIIVQATIAGISTGGLFIIVPIYIREISADRIRGLTISLMMLMTSAGNAMKLILSYDSMLYLMVALVAIEVVTVFYIPESPSFFVKTDKLHEAKISVAKLHCLNQDDPSVANEIHQLKEDSERAKSNGNLSICVILRNKMWRDQIKIGLFLNTTTILSGCNIFLNQDKSLAQLKTDIDPQKTLVPLCLLVGGLTCVIFVIFLERRYLITISYSIMILSMGVLAVFTQADLTVTSVRWLPIVALAILVFSYGMVWNMPAVVLVEMLNLEIRVMLIGIVFVYSQIIKLAHTLTFQYLEDYVGIYTLLYLFACINIFGAIYAISMLPDIKNKSVKQIEKQMRKRFSLMTEDNKAKWKCDQCFLNAQNNLSVNVPTNNSFEILTDDENSDIMTILTQNSKTNSCPDLRKLNMEDRIENLETQNRELKEKLQIAEAEIENILLENTKLKQLLCKHEIKTKFLADICSPTLKKTTTTRKTRKSINKTVLDFLEDEKEECSSNNLQQISSTPSRTKEKSHRGSAGDLSTPSHQIHNSSPASSLDDSANQKKMRKPIIHIIGDQQARGLAAKLKLSRSGLHNDCYTVSGMVKPFASSSEVLRSCTYLQDSLNNNDILILSADLAKEEMYGQLSDHTMVTDMELFPYVVAVLKMTNYLSAGAMISENWVLTAADALFLVRESIRILRVRLGSINYKKGGQLYPIKYFRIHPYFDDKKPEYDLALLKLSEPVRWTSSIHPIRLLRKPKEITVTHFIVTAWPPHYTNQFSRRKTFHDSLDFIKRSRILSVQQMHPMEEDECHSYQDKSGVLETGTLLCLDPTLGSDPCKRDAGAPVVLNGVLWGIVSSWRPEDCEEDARPSFVNLIASPNISSWINAVMQDVQWKLEQIEDESADNYI